MMTINGFFLLETTSTSGLEAYPLTCKRADEVTEKLIDIFYQFGPA